MNRLDIAKNRATPKWSHHELALRILWALVLPFFHFSPRPIWGWRRMLLRVFGARIGTSVHIYPSVRITMPWNIDVGDFAAVGDRAILYALGPITIGARATVSQGAHLCAGTHNIRKPDRPLMKPPITIGEDVWVAADAFIGPDVEIGAGAIVGARAVVFKSVNPGMIVVGNQARAVRSISENDN